MFSAGDSVQLNITDLSRNGEGIGRIDGFAVFVPGTVPGDGIEAGLTWVGKNYARGQVLRIISPSAYRAEPPCPAAGACGGCQLQNMTYEKGLAWKQQMVTSAVTRIGGIDLAGVTIEDITAADPVLHSRNKMIFPVGTDENGLPAAGFYARGTHDIVRCTSCVTGPVESGLIVNAVLMWMRTHGIPAYDEATGRGIVRHIFIRRSRSSGDIQLCLVVNAEHIPAVSDLKRAVGRIDGVRVVSALINTNTRKTNVIFGRRFSMLWGEEKIRDTLRSEVSGAELTYEIAAPSFYQVNPWIAEKMYDKALELAGLSGDEGVLDLYCGTGTMSLFMAKRAGHVTGVEAVEEAVRDARANARINSIANADFICGNVEDIVPRLGQRAGVVVVDPPRKGCGEKLLSSILEIAPERIVYVSCDPATLARDLKYLSSGGYALRHLCAFDQFVFTSHVETVVLMARA